MENENNLFQSMLDNYINGNLSDFREQIGKLSKWELIAFIEFLHDESQYIEETLQGFNMIFQQIKLAIEEKTTENAG